MRIAVKVVQAYRDSHPSPSSATRSVTANSVVACPDYGEERVGSGISVQVGEGLAGGF